MATLEKGGKRVMWQRIAVGVFTLAAFVLAVDTVNAVVVANAIRADSGIHAPSTERKPYMLHTALTPGFTTGRVHTMHTVHREGTYRVHTGHTLKRTGTYPITKTATPHFAPDTDVVEHSVLNWVREWFRSRF